MDPVLAARLVKLGGEEWEGHGAWMRVEKNALFQLLEAKHLQGTDDAAFKQFCVGMKFPQDQGGAARPRTPSQYEVAAPAVSRLLVKGECAGTAFAIAVGTRVLVITARHCVQEGNKLLPATAFGQPLTFVLAQPRHDLAIYTVTSPPEHPLRVSLQDVSVGQTVSLLAFQKAVDEEHLAQALEDTPSCCGGYVVKTFLTGHLVIGNYGGGMPNASGGPVVDASGRVAGMHGGTVYHHHPTSGHEAAEVVEAPDIIEWDPNNVWIATPSTDPASDDCDTAGTGHTASSNPSSPEVKQTSSDPDSGSSGDSTQLDLSARLDAVHLHADHAVQNIHEKGCLSAYVPVQTIANVLVKAELVKDVPEGVASAVAQKRKAQTPH